MPTTRPIMLSSAVAIVAIIIIASAQAQAQAQVAVSPAQGDANITVPPGTAVVVPTQTGSPRTPEDVNAPNAPLTHTHTDASTPVTDPNAGADNGDTSYMTQLHVHDAGNGVTYVSGGVGIHAKAQIDAISKDYRLKLLFAAASGPYLANVHAVITDKGGASVLDITTDGPFVLVNLPAGTYTVSGTYENTTVTKKVSVGRTGTHSYTLTFAQPVS